MCCVHTVEHYAALKEKEILLHAKSLLNLEDFMLSEISQSQKNKYCVITLIWSI